MPRVTLSYRRDDSAGIARLIYERLKPRYGADSVFMDIDAIEFGEDYRERINHALRQTDYLLVLIGPRWLGPLEGRRDRIQDANDPVRVEVERALEIGLRVVPVLLEHTPMPSPDDLPETLVRLPYLNAAEVTSGREFDGQIERIARFIDRTFGETEARRAREQQERNDALAAAAPPPTRPDVAASSGAVRVDLAAPSGDAPVAGPAPHHETAPSAVARDRTPTSRPRTNTAIAFGLAGLVLAGLIALVILRLFSRPLAATISPAHPTAAAQPVAAVPPRAAAAVPAGFVVMYDRLAGLSWKVTRCSDGADGASVGFQLFNDYRIPVNFDVALTTRMDHPAARDWLSGRRRLVPGVSPELAKTLAGYRCGAGDLYAGLRKVRFGPDRGPYVRL